MALKSLILIRHAKSSWGDALLSDFERPLNERGKAEAPAMAAKLFQSQIPISHFVSSPAKRAKKTARYFLQAYGLAAECLVLVPALYQANLALYQDLVAHLDDRHDSVAIFSHNPGITDFVNGLTSTKIDQMPTCGVFAVRAEIEAWKDFADVSKTFWFFQYPKQALGL